MNFFKDLFTVAFAALNWWQTLIFLSLILALTVVIVLIKYRPNFLRRKRLSCSNCIQIIFSKREKAEAKRNKVENRILKNQMNFAEQKLIEMNSLFINNYSEIMNNLRNDSFDFSDEVIQQKLYWGILFESLEKLIKDELRRSFKENGFYDISGAEFSQYVKNQSKRLIELLKQQIRNTYPPSGLGMLVSQQDLLNDIDTKEPKIEDIAFEIYIEAKRLKSVAGQEISKIEEDFEEELKTFEKEELGVK